MTPRGDAFFNAPLSGSDFRVASFKGSFDRPTSVPNTHWAYNRQSSYLRWARGYEIAQAVAFDNAWNYPFFYEIRVPGVTDGSVVPQIPGVFIGYPTGNKEFGMHWAGCRLPGSLRTDNLRTTSSDGLPIEYCEVNEEFFNVKILGDWSESRPLPPPLYVPSPFGPQYPLVGETFEDRVIEQGGELITRETLNPETGLRYGYVSAVLVQVQPFTGILRFRRTGSVWTSPDRVAVTPSPVGFTAGRWFSTAGRYVCTCQDFLGRDYAWISRLQGEARSGRAPGKWFPYTNPRSVKIGKNERITTNGRIDQRAQTSISENRRMELIDGTRDAPGIYADFGATYLNNGVGPPMYNDYKVDENGDVVYESNMWTQQLDEMRYCKHIYAMKFDAGDPVPEPSDYPIGVSAAEIEASMERERKRTDDLLMTRAEYGIAYMDVPPYNCQAPMMMPIVSKLLNLPSALIRMENFVMQDPVSGESYRPAERPSGN